MGDFLNRVNSVLYYNEVFSVRQVMDSWQWYNAVANPCEGLFLHSGAAGGDFPGLGIFK